jgi:GNAT superfamily N-acetyltransferase
MNDVPAETTHAAGHTRNRTSGSCGACQSEQVTVETRIALPTDAAEIASVHIRSWQDAYRGIVPGDYLDALDIGERTHEWVSILTETAEGFHGSTSIVALVDGVLAGFATVGGLRGADAADNAGEIYSIYASPAVWGIGVGRALMNAAVVQLERRDHRNLCLWVLEANTRARTFYERQGWNHDGETQTIEVGGRALPELRYARRQPDT